EGPRRRDREPTPRTTLETVSVGGRAGLHPSEPGRRPAAADARDVEGARALGRRAPRLLAHARAARGRRIDLAGDRALAPAAPADRAARRIRCGDEMGRRRPRAARVGDLGGRHEGRTGTRRTPRAGGCDAAEGAAPRALERLRVRARGRTIAPA